MFHVGSGIFITPKYVAIGSGSVGMTMLSWVICGLISIFGKYRSYYKELSMHAASIYICLLSATMLCQHYNKATVGSWWELFLTLQVKMRDYIYVDIYVNIRDTTNMFRLYYMNQRDSHCIITICLQL